MWTPGPAKGVFLLLQVRVCHAILGGNSHRIGVKRQPPSSPLFPLSSRPSLGSEAGTQFHAVITLLSLHCLFKIYIYLFTWLCWASVAVLGLSRCGTWALEHVGLVAVACRLSCSVACGILVPQPGIEPASPSLKGRFLATGSPGKSLTVLLSIAAWKDITSFRAKSDPVWWPICYYYLETYFTVPIHQIITPKHYPCSDMLDMGDLALR